MASLDLTWWYFNKKILITDFCWTCVDMRHTRSTKCWLGVSVGTGMEDSCRRRQRQRKCNARGTQVMVIFPFAAEYGNWNIESQYFQVKTSAGKRKKASRPSMRGRAAPPQHSMHGGHNAAFPFSISQVIETKKNYGPSVTTIRQVQRPFMHVRWVFLCRLHTEPLWTNSAFLGKTKRKHPCLLSSRAKKLDPCFF